MSRYFLAQGTRELHWSVGSFDNPEARAPPRRSTPWDRGIGRASTQSDFNDLAYAFYESVDSVVPNSIANEIGLWLVPTSAFQTAFRSSSLKTYMDGIAGGDAETLVLLRACSFDNNDWMLRDALFRTCIADAGFAEIPRCAYYEQRKFQSRILQASMELVMLPCFSYTSISNRISTDGRNPRKSHSLRH